jgi:hypothetical protein
MITIIEKIKYYYVPSNNNKINLFLNNIYNSYTIDVNKVLASYENNFTNTSATIFT